VVLVGTAVGGSLFLVVLLGSACKVMSTVVYCVVLQQG
jgi:hypothetical protein